MKCKWLDPELYFPGDLAFITNKYLIELEWSPVFYSSDCVALTHTIPPTFYNRVAIINKKNKKYIIPLNLFFSILPDLDDMYKYVSYLSDKRVNEKIERILKLLIFS
jgi:hypothetical protein